MNPSARANNKMTNILNYLNMKRFNKFDHKTFIYYIQQFFFMAFVWCVHISLCNFGLKKKDHFPDIELQSNKIIVKMGSFPENI